MSGNISGGKSRLHNYIWIIGETITQATTTTPPIIPCPMHIKYHHH
jgi:hypothetical protein